MQMYSKHNNDIQLWTNCSCASQDQQESHEVFTTSEEKAYEEIIGS